MDNKKMQMIADILNKDLEFTKELIAMEPYKAAEALNAKGYEVTEADLIAFAEACKKAAANGEELSETELTDVAGGCWGCFVVGVAIGFGIVALPW